MFISYAHEDDGGTHAERVRDLWLLLRRNGVDARLDRPAAEQPQNWATWMLREYQAADYVLVVASPAYKRRAEGTEDPGVGEGVAWEAGLIRAEIYRDRGTWHRRILRVVLPGGSREDFPAFFGGHAVTDYTIDPLTAVGAERLLRYLHRQPFETEPPPGPIPFLPPRGTDDVETEVDELARLRRLSEAATEDAALIVPPGSLYPIGISLERLYVRRNIETVLIERLKIPSAHVVVGEPGYGKTSLLWSLHRTLAELGWEPFFIKATALLSALDTLGVERADAIDLETLDRALNVCLERGITAVLLVDTLDLLMHSADTRRIVSDLLQLAQRGDIRMVVTCRPGEAALLQPGEEEGAGLRLIRLGLYDDAERQSAVAGYTETFYGLGPSRMLAASDLRDVQAHVFSAVYQDLPLREVCDNPLTLRLLFELYAPNRPDRQVDVASLYDRFWELRIRRDARGGENGATGPVRRVEDGDDSAADLRGTARTLAQFMLGSGNPEVSLSQASSEIARLEPMELAEVSRRIELLVRRGVLAVSPASGTVRFFHQTFFEYAAAQFLVVAGLADELILRVCADPGDLLLAAVAAQALPRLASRAESERLLTRLLEDDGQSAVTLGLGIYAHQPGAAAEAQQALRTAAPDSVRRFLLLLPGIRHEDPARWTGDLDVVWKRTGEADRDLRIPLLEALRRLAGRSPEDAVEFLDGHGCLSWIRGQKSQLLRSHEGLHLRLLGPVYAADPSWVRGELIALWDLFVEAKNAQGAAEILDLLRERLDLVPAERGTAERNRVLEDFAPRLRALADAVSMRSAAPAIRAYGLLWSAGRSAMEPDSTLALAKSLIDEASRAAAPTPGAGREGSGPDALTRAHLHGVGSLARALPGDQARSLVAAMTAIRTPGLQTAVLDGIILPLLGQDHHGNVPLHNDNAMVRCLETACRTELSRLPGPEKREDGSRAPAAVFVEAVVRSQRSGPGLLELLPESEPDLWLRLDGLARLTAAAAAAGHPIASRALRLWCSDPAPRRQRPSKSLQTALLTPLLERVSTQPQLLAYLVDDAIVSQDPQTLVAALDLAGAAALSCVVEDYRADLQGLLTKLTRANSGQDRRRGYRLWRALVENTGWQPPSPGTLVVQLRGKPGTPQHISVLELCLAAVVSGGWTAADAAQLLPALRDLVDADRADARHLMMAILCRTGALDTPEQRVATIKESLELALPADYGLDEADGRGRFTTNMRQLGWLVERLLKVDTDAALSLLLDVSAVLDSVNPGIITRVQREIANRWRRPLGLAFDALGSQARKRLVLGLLQGDVALARLAIEVFAQRNDPPPWFRQLLMDSSLHPKLLDTIRGNLFFHARSHGSGPWRELI
ncbi:toll/interleukin-1 receptor domain-containing protein [Kitasatospora sp. MAA4]|uniref:toll/interleukin-1 receptor domain-containing protein n=1 Tax=Kitasatospora sp. MAA4 TaxID=3035093 RepID=UPI0024744FF6|nr:toll/interleukin-1 receptor domain-containing protein [Kitasatospora sp. MAA4]